MDLGLITVLEGYGTSRIGGVVQVKEGASSDFSKRMVVFSGGRDSDINRIYQASSILERYENESWR